MTRPPFFSRYAKVQLAIDQILPRSGKAGADSPYTGYIQSLSRSALDSDLGRHRSRSLEGSLEEADLTGLNNFFEGTKAGRDLTADGFLHYAMLNAQAMSIGQILFVNNCVREGLPLKVTGYQDLLRQLSGDIGRISVGNGAALTRIEARFFAALFVLQSAFDRLFVPPEPVGRYDFYSGEYLLSDGWL